jgi:hypothetical protein
MPYVCRYVCVHVNMDARSSAWRRQNGVHDADLLMMGRLLWTLLSCIAPARFQIFVLTGMCALCSPGASLRYDMRD